MSAWERRTDLEPAGTVANRFYSRKGQDWPRFQLRIDALGEGMVTVLLLIRHTEKHMWERSIVIPRPMLDELGVVVAEACGQIPRVEG